MPLKFKVGSKDELPAEHAGLYREQNGAWVLDVEGAVERQRVEEIRQTNASLAKERDELLKRFEGIDPAAVRQLAEEKRKLEEAQALRGSAPDVEKVLESRLKTVRGDFEKQLSNLASERDALHQRLVTLQIDQGVVSAATKRGLRATALPDITARARNVFRLVQGMPTAFEPDGQTVRMGKDGLTPMTLEEWMDGQVVDAPHLFEGNSGAGTGNSGRGPSSWGGGGTLNPWRREHWNVTEQMRLMKRDPALAQRLKATAAS